MKYPSLVCFLLPPARGAVRRFLSLSFCLTALGTVRAQTPEWPTLGLSQFVTNTFASPTCITHAADGSQRLFVLEQKGRILTIQNGIFQSQPFLEISNRVLSTGSEQGLLGLAFSPGFATNHHLYVCYTRQPDGAVLISRFSAGTTPAPADPNSEQVVLVIPKPFNNHNGGQLAFGPDGYLYVGVGDGGSEGDPSNRGQNPLVLLGKLLRIDVEQSLTYSVPQSNPFVGNT